MPTGKNCARCVTPTRATITAAFAYEKTNYQIPLCEPHATMFDRDMIGWLRLATEVDAQPSAITPLRPRDDSPPIRRFIPKGPPREVNLDEYEAPNVRAVIRPGALEYQFTKHAEERMQERGISRREVYQLIADPSKSRTTSKNGTHVYRKGDLKIVVNEIDKMIITVGADPIEEMVS